MSAAIQSIQAQLPKDAMAHFKTLQTDDKRFQYAWGLPCIQGVLSPRLEYCNKSPEQAAHHRTRGNAHFQKKSYLTALGEYNLAIMQAATEAEKDDHHLPMVYANRSATLFYLKRYELCIRDTELAIETGYPKDMQYKLFDRQGKCYLCLGKGEKAVASFQQAQEGLTKAKLDENTCNKWQAVLSKQLEEARTLTENGVAEDGQPQSKVPQLKNNHNKTFPSVSAAVNVAWKSNIGRHMVANDDITVGDVLVVEKPYTSVLYPEFYATHCYNCQCRVLAPVPCTQCSSVVYCSLHCRDTCWESIHKYDCQCLTLYGPGWCGRIGHLAARLAMVTGWPELLKYRTQVINGQIQPGEKERQGISELAVYGNNYHAIHNLVTNAKQRTADGLFDFTVFAVFLLKVLQLGQMVPEVDNQQICETRLCNLGGMLLHHLQLIQCNAHAIKEVQRPTDFQDLQLTDIGIGVYPTASLINHSCDSNTELLFYDNVIVSRATRNIRNGEEVACSYGPSFFNTEYRERVISLKFRYSFDCKCRACRQKWPQWQQVEASIPKLLCQGCGIDLPQVSLQKKTIVKCKQCKHSQDVADIVGELEGSHDEYARAVQDAVEGKNSEALPSLQHHLVLMQRCLGMPWRDFVACQQAVSNCYRLQANRRQF